MAELMAAGISAVDSLDILAGETKASALGKAATTLKKNLRQGMGLSGAMAADKSFPSFVAAMVRAGEKGGSLVWILEKLGAYYAGQAAFEVLILKTLFYPVVVLAMAVAVIIFMSVWVLPVFAGIYDSMGITPPLLTRAVLAVSRRVLPCTVLMAVFGVVAALYLRWLRGRRGFRLGWGRKLLEMPVTGSIRKNGELANFFQALGMMTAGGVDLITALKVSGQVVKNVWIAKVIDDAARRVSRGEKLSQAFEHRLLGERAHRLILMGEATGELDGCLLRAGESFRRAAERRMRMTAALLEPASILVVGALVFVVVLAVMLPVFGIYENYAQLF